jgi:HJR/Mrr/RecB family endonuclease
MNTFLELLVTVGRFFVGLWPLMCLAVLVGIFKRRNGFGAMLRTSIKAIIISWVFFAILNLVFYFLKMDTFHLLPATLDRKYFLLAGIILVPFIVALILEERHKKINADTIEQMRALSPSDFETLVADTYRAQGHSVEVVGATGDHGIDLVVNTRRGETWLVQCKKYRGKVGEPIIRDFYGALRASEADAGAVVTTGSITEQARLWAEGKPLHLYDGVEFLKIVQTTKIKRSLPQEVKRKRASLFTPAPVLQPAYAVASHQAMVENVQPDPQPDKRPFMNSNLAPDCPACGVPMMLHSEKRFFRKPRQIYICPNAPSCSETQEL